MRKKLSILIVALLASMSIQSAMAWGTFGHGAIAYVAEQHLTPNAKAECRRYLKHTLPYYASWMDLWRAVPPFHPTDNWQRQLCEFARLVGASPLVDFGALGA